MKKRLGFLSLFGITALLIVMVGAIAALAAPSTAVTGTIKLDRAWYTNAGAGATVKITVEDADANVPVSQTHAGLAVTADAEGAGQFVQLSPDGGTTDANNLVGTPVVVPAGGTTADAYDNTVANFTVTNAALGRGTLSVDGVTVKAADTVDIIYNFSIVDTVDVKVTSTQDPTGFTVTATETGFDTGKFEATIKLDADASSVTTTPNQLRALNTNLVTASYKDTTPSSGTSVTVKATATVETSDPSFASLSPADGFSTQATQPEITGTINDVGGSGIDVSEVKITIKNAAGADAGGTPATPSVSGNDGDATVTFKFTPTSLPEGSYTWQVDVADIAGNTASSDSDEDTADVAEPHDLKIDLSPPDFVSAATGKAWDTDSSSEKSNKLNSLVVVFSEALDSNSVSAADFLVGGATPLDAQVFSKASTKVYITLASDMAADDEPTIAIASGGAVSDKAGNSRNTGSVDAADEIAPTFTVTLDKTLTKDKVVISVTANEPIAGVPEIKVYNEDVGVTPKTLSAIVKGATSWEATFSESAAYEGDNGVVVTGLDGSGNLGTAGKTDPSDSKAIAFTQDTTPPGITTYEAGGVDITAASPKVTSTNPFVTIKFSEKVTVTKAEFGVDGSTLTDVTSDGKASSDRKTWIYAAAGLDVGEDYTINVTFEDDAGNETKDQAATFEVIEKPKVSIPVKPGMNLLSLSGEPENPDINVVLTDPDVTSVTTYDPNNPNPETGSPWLTATRNADGTWDTSGGLATIDSKHAYWVKTSSFAPVKVSIPDLGFAATPPAIPVVTGWNLVPVTSLTGAAPGTTISADIYFGSLPGWVTAYSFDPQTNAWTKVLPRNFDTVTVGLGYWLYVTAPGILVP